MPLVPLAQIKPNPFRDFELHQIDEVQVERLKASIDADGFWSSVVARKVADEYEVAFGHHRIEAARALGLEAVPIEVRDLSDWQMVRMLASENATQRGSTAAACLDAVAAISRVLAYNLLRWDEARFVENMTKLDFDYARCRGRLEAGSGIGDECIRAFAPKDAFTRSQTEAALGTLKDSGRMAAIVAAASAKAEAELRAEQEAVESALAEAERKEALARSKAEKQAAAKVTKSAKQAATKSKKATEATGKASAAVERKPIIYDARCAQLFRLDSHAETFRKVVTGETFQAYLPLSEQVSFAKTVLKRIKEHSPANHVITAADIRRECWSQIESGVGRFKANLRTAPERPYVHEIREGLNLLRRGMGDVRRAGAVLTSAFRKGERLDLKQTEQFDRHVAAIEAVLVELRPHREALKLKLIRNDGENSA